MKNITNKQIKNGFFYKDPVHHTIDFSGKNAWLFELTKTPEFRRLAFIKQLGTANMMFPGATATRLSHCLGAYEIARRFLNNLPIISKLKKEPNAKFNIKTTLAAALLHDLGHGPYSHLFEECINIDDNKIESKNLKKFVHEDFSKKLILDKNGKIYGILKRQKLNPEKIADLLFEQKDKSILPWMQQLISSELDADRIDYLLRDSYYTGANYGFVDLQLLIRWARYDEHDQRIYYQIGSVPLLESFLFSRYQMYRNVYYNPASYLSAWQVRAIFGILKKRIWQEKIKPSDPIFANPNGQIFCKTIYKMLIGEIDNVQLSDYLLLNDYTFLAIINLLANCSDRLLSKLALAHVRGTNFFQSKWFSSVKELDEGYQNYLDKYKSIVDTDAKFLVFKLFPRNINLYSSIPGVKRIWVGPKENICDLAKLSPVVKYFSDAPLTEQTGYHLIYVGDLKNIN